jgi:hypothetical protein
MAVTEQVSRQQLTRAVIASTVGTSIEWYDFFLYGSAAALVLNQQFFPNVDPTSGVLLAFGTNFVGFIARPSCWPWSGARGAASAASSPAGHSSACRSGCCCRMACWRW